MTDSIKAGDTVQVVRRMPCCGNDSSIGAIFTVWKIKYAWGACPYCGHRCISRVALKNEHESTHVSRLVKYGELGDLEENDEGILQRD